MTQPKALQLAESTHLGYRVSWQKATAAELRRLYEVNQMLVNTLKEIESLPGISSANLYARKALAKLKEKNT